MITLLFTLEYPPFKGGVANYYGNIVRYWAKSASVDLGLEDDNPATKLRVLHNNDNALLFDWIYPHWLPSVWNLKSAIKRQKVEHVIVGHILPLGTVARYVCRKENIPYSVILHGMDLALAMRPGRKQVLAKKILQDANSIICSNNYTAELALRFVGQSIGRKIYVVHPGVNSEVKADEDLKMKIRKKYNLANKTILFSCGRLEKRKGFDKVIEVMPRASLQVNDLHYFIAGDGVQKVSLIKKTMSSKNITYLGRISDDEKNAWLSLCDIFVMPSYVINEDFEGFGIVYLEANAFGKPVIAGNSGGVPEAVEDGVSGILVDPLNGDELAGAIIKLAQNPSLRQELGRQGKERAVNKFNWPRQVDKFYKIINQ